MLFIHSNTGRIDTQINPIQRRALYLLFELCKRPKHCRRGQSFSVAGMGRVKCLTAR